MSFKYNGGTFEDFVQTIEDLHVQAGTKGVDEHIQWKPEDIRPDGSVPEEVFLQTRPCEPGKEEETCHEKYVANLKRLDEKFKAQKQLIKAAYKEEELQGQKICDLRLKFQNDCDLLERGFDKTVQEMRSSCDLYDKAKQKFSDQRATAVALLNSWFGPGPKNKIYKILNEVGPKNALKRLVDEFYDEAGTSDFLNTTTIKMSTLIFDPKKIGCAANHMRLLDDLNAPLVRAGQPISDGQLLAHLMSAMDRHAEAKKTYAEAVGLIRLQDIGRADAMRMFARIELSQLNKADLNGERKSKVGAQYAKVKGFAGAAAVQKIKKGKRKREEGSGGGKSDSGGKKPKADSGGGSKATPFCNKCGGPHWRKDCTETVYCSKHKSDHHSDDVCYDQHPEMRPKYHKVGNRK